MTKQTTIVQADAMIKRCTNVVAEGIEAAFQKMIKPLETKTSDLESKYDSKICTLNETVKTNYATLLEKFQDRELKTERSLLAQKNQTIKALRETIDTQNSRWYLAQEVSKTKTKTNEDLQAANEQKDQTIKQLRRTLNNLRSKTFEESSDSDDELDILSARNKKSS